MEISEKQKKILEILKENMELATTRISFMLSSNLYQTEAYLEELKILDLIEKEQRNNATYWRIKEKK